MNKGVWLATPMGLQRIDHDLATEWQCALIMERSGKYIVKFFFKCRTIYLVCSYCVCDCFYELNIHVCIATHRKLPEGYTWKSQVVTLGSAGVLSWGKLLFIDCSIFFYFSSSELYNKNKGKDILLSRANY